MAAKRIVLLGNGKPALDCLKVLLSQEPGDTDAARELAFVLTDATNQAVGASLGGFCADNDVPYHTCRDVNARETIELLRAVRPDIVLSVNNFQIIRRPFLELPQVGVVNFHNAPLPKYAGLNACSWAIFDGRSEHGVTWHLVDEGVDSGDILAQEHFPIPPGATAISLIMESIRRGVELFAKVLDDMVAGRLARQAQDGSARVFHRRSEVPGEGRIDFAWSCDQLDRLFRALDFHPFQAELGFPRAEHRGRTFYAGKATLTEGLGAGSPGTVLVADEELVVATLNGVARLADVRDARMERTSVKQLISDYGIKPGDTIQGEPRA